MHVFFSRRNENTRSSASVHLSLKVLRSRMSKATAHTAIRGDGRVCVADVSDFEVQRQLVRIHASVMGKGKHRFLSVHPSQSNFLQHSISYGVSFCSPSQGLHNNRWIQLRHKPQLPCRACVIFSFTERNAVIMP